MSPDANKTLIRRWVEAWNRADLAAIDQIFAPTYTVNAAPVGPEGVKQAVQHLRTAFSPVTLTIDDLVAEGDHVAVRWAVQGIHSGVFMDIPATGKPIRFSGINIYRSANNQIASNHEQVDVQGLLKQLGVSPPGSVIPSPPEQ